MGDETANSMNLDLNLGIRPEFDEALYLEGFMEAVNRPNESLSQGENDFLRQSQLIDSLRQREIERLRLRRISDVDQLSERLMQREIHSLRQSDRILGIRENFSVRTGRRRRYVLPLAPTPPEITPNIISELTINPVVDPSSSFLSGEARVNTEERDTDVLKATENNTEVNTEKEESGEKGNEDKGNDDDMSSFFDCNICLDLAKDPVVTCCGHLFCWACVYQWLVHSVANECPVCKGEVTIETVTPIYGRRISTRRPEGDPSGLKIPARPHAQRVEGLRQSMRRNSGTNLIDDLIMRLSERTSRMQRDQDAEVANITASRNALVDRIALIERERENTPLPFEDMDSLSTLAAVIRSDSQSVDTSSSRVSDVVGGYSRAHQRRRLN